jgi:hypothetical protein
MIAFAALALLAVANAQLYSPQTQGVFGYPWKQGLMTQRAQFMGLASGYGYPSTTPFSLHGFQDIQMVKSKLFQGIPCDISDFLVCKHTLPYLPQEEVDEIEEIIKKKIVFTVPDLELHRFEAAILKECVKVKVERGVPIDKLGSEILKEVVKAKIFRGIPVDEKEAKICANNIKNKLVKKEPVDPLDAEVLLEYVKNKVARREPITNLEAELCLELLKLKAISGEPLDSVEAEVVVDCVRNKARRGSPLDRLGEDLLIKVVEDKQLIKRIGNRALELAVQVMKNKEKRGEPIMTHHSLPTTVIPHEVKQPISLLDKTHFDDKIRFVHQNPLRSAGRLHSVAGFNTFGMNPWTMGTPFRGLNTLGFGSTWNRCPTSGFYDVLGRSNLYSPYGFQPNVMSLRYGRGLTIPFRMQAFGISPLTTGFTSGTWGKVLPTWNLI